MNTEWVVLLQSHLKNMLFVWVLWYINLCWLFNVKSILIQINSSISNTLEGTSRKLIDKFSYLGSSVSSTEKDIDTRLTDAPPGRYKTAREEARRQLHKNVASNIE